MQQRLSVLWYGGITFVATKHGRARGSLPTARDSSPQTRTGSWFVSPLGTTSPISREREREPVDDATAYTTYVLMYDSHALC